MLSQPGRNLPQSTSHPLYSLKAVLQTRFSLVLSLLSVYVLLSFILRTILVFISFNNLSGSFLNYIKAFALGSVFDLSVALFFVFFYLIYLLVLPKKLTGSIFDRIFTYGYLSLILLIMFFSLMAELPFWDEFGARYNFIAVDYLVYTYEVIGNINQSYPLPLIILVLLLLIVLTIFILKKKKALFYTLSDKKSFLQRAKYLVPLLAVTIIAGFFLKNKYAEFSKNITLNELTKNGTFSFFAAFRANELDYKTFYATLDDKKAYDILRTHLLQNNQQYITATADNISRDTKGTEEKTPNIVLIAIESFGSEFLKTFGNNDDLTSHYEALAGESIFFTNLYATGTRTVRGMEALTLCVPPTPGNSIVRRPDNQNLFSIATVLKKRNYHPYFIYGGDGYFDNMNTFFGGQGFDIVDRNRGNLLSDNIKTQRFSIPDSEVSFENAWGVCDGDIYKQSIKYADMESKKNERFFQFIMTTSNHKPYTFPPGKIDLPQGSREAAVKYTDEALAEYIKVAKTKPWFSNTVFVIVADHCSSSAGKWEINIEKHHIPAIIYNLDQKPAVNDRLMSQIDIMPTLFGYLGWNYQSSFYGKDINQVKPGDERAFIGNYRTLGLLKTNIFTQLNDKKNTSQFEWNNQTRMLTELKTSNDSLVAQAISYYQTASERFKLGKMKAE